MEKDKIDHNNRMDHFDDLARERERRRREKRNRLRQTKRGYARAGRQSKIRAGSRYTVNSRGTRHHDNGRMLLKLAVLCAGLVVLFLCMLTGIRVVTDLDKRAEGIKKAEAAVLMRALCEEVLQEGIEAQNEEQKEAMPTYEMQLKAWEEAGEEALTYQELRKLTALLERADGPEGAEKQTVGRTAFYQDYFAMVEAYDLSEVIVRKEMVVLADGENIELTGQEQDDQGKIVVAEDGWYQDKSNRAGDFLFCPMETVVKRTQLLAIEKEPELEGSKWQISNIWLVEREPDSLRCFWNNTEFNIALPEALQDREDIKREQIADIAFADGQVRDVTCKQDKISGKILSIGENMIEVEGAGTLFFADQLKIYKLYGEMERYYTSQLRVGYAFTDFVLEDGKVAACLVTKDEAMENIRVLIQAGNYNGTFHEEVTVSCDTGYEVICGEEKESRQAGEITQITKDSPYFKEQGRILIRPSALTGRIRLSSIQRSQGIPEYRGTLEIVKNSDGIFVVNEVLLEEYLYAVVPSEMPSSYPMEALKAQAICARTYAYRKMERAGLAKYGAHVDDSTTYQVYNNILENAQTTKAVKETKGALLYVNEEPADTYYYSTSCGFGTNADIWKGGNSSALGYLVPRHISADAPAEGSDEEDTARIEEDPALQMMQEEYFRSYIEAVNEADYESDQGWYRWTYQVQQLDVQNLEERIRTRYQNNPNLVLTKEGDQFVSKEIPTMGKIKEISVAKRGPGGIIDELIIEGDQATVKVITEHNVRYVLCSPSSQTVMRKDGSEASVSSLLPSSFFVIYPSKDNDTVVGYNIVGGGFGHGVGMSQNAAKGMADTGMDCASILSFFYEGASIETIYT